MLLKVHPKNDKVNDLDSIHNFYEKLVIAEIIEQSEQAKSDGDFLADAACVALNHLPPRYIRYDVDMTFFLSPQEQKEIHDKIVRAVTDAISYVEKRVRPKHD